MANVLILGHCGYDGPRLAKVTQKAGGKPIEIDASDDAIAFMHNNKVKLVLVNRVFDNGEEGLPFIQQAVKDFPDVQFMLISNFEDAQATAKTYGAVQGFGKQKLDDPQTLELLKNILA